jgi:hypothetical protein
MIARSADSLPMVADFMTRDLVTLSPTWKSIAR